ncbi:hypothetical protein HJG60_011479 [Phyllostomus discolor]|uniref:Uncharacterized protein n=1 Tax=Phyllostomus discolor TaxID=89673 RepID=A0A833ZY34_9CHIR|nr:hypothetical protein HJG60_011479 [Phyllostomus discolor]
MPRNTVSTVEEIPNSETVGKLIKLLFARTMCSEKEKCSRGGRNTARLFKPRRVQRGVQRRDCWWTPEEIRERLGRASGLKEERETLTCPERQDSGRRLSPTSLPENFSDSFPSRTDRRGRRLRRNKVEKTSM